MTARKPKRTPTLEERAEILRAALVLIDELDIEQIRRAIRSTLRAIARDTRKVCAKECREVAREVPFACNCAEVCADRIARRKP